jgi:two-component system sensor histidine kinase RegB
MNFAKKTPAPAELPGAAARPLAWLVKLRWTAVLAQGATVLVAMHGLGLRLPLVQVWGLIALTALSNLFLHHRARRDVTPGHWLTAGVLAFDSLNLTGLLALTGGAHNAFSSFYLVHVTLAAVLLPARWTWTLAALCTACFATLFTPGLPEAICGDARSFNEVRARVHLEQHLQGMLVSFGITSAVIAFFVVRVNDQLRQRERELHQARLLAAQNERFAALTTLAAGVAHELGSPLGTIAVASGELARAAACLPSGTGLAEDAELIRAEVERCRRILERMNRDSTGGTEELAQATDAAAIVRESQARLRPAEATRVQVLDSTAGVSWKLPRALLAQALANLIKNGCDASAATVPVQLRLRSAAGALEIEVQDAGTGIAPGDLSRLGEPFFTTKPPGQGMGLGLFLVRVFAQRVSGAIEFESEPGRFTIARLRLPFPIA